MQEPDGASRGDDSGGRQLPPLVPPPRDSRFGGPGAGTGAGPAAGTYQGSQQQGSQQQSPQQPAAQPQYPLARVFDGVKPDGAPSISRPQLDPREIPALLAYLTRATVALAAPGTTRDEMVASAPANVPRAFHTDGVWVWPAAVGYYLGLYQLPPQPELLAHIRSRRHVLAPVRPQVGQAVSAQLMAMLNAHQGPQEPAQRQQPAKPAPEPLPQRHPKPKPKAEPRTEPPAAVPEAVHQEPAPIAQPAGQKPAIAAPEPVQSPDAMTLAEFSAPFNAAGNRHAAWVTEQLEAFLDYLPLGDWSVDHTTRSYQQSGRDFQVDALGALSPGGVWTWSWANPEMWGGDPALVEQSLRLRELGEHHAIPELVTPAFGVVGIADAPQNPHDAAEMIAWTSMGILGACGYIGHSASADDDGGRIYYVVCDPGVPMARPRIEDVPRVLIEGADTFGEGSVDCVIGYVEHHGWEWSRVPEGVAVAAPGIGSFTALVSRIGELTGVRLGVGAPEGELLQTELEI
ncbi:MAG: DUF6882 domain-containing protein [Actinocrinis sp.]